MTNEVISLLPEFGVEWGIWGGLEDGAFEHRTEFITPDELGLNGSLSRRLRKWNDDWLDYYLFEEGEGPLGWDANFDLNAWIREGLLIAREIELQTTFTVNRRFLSYLKVPLPLL